MRSLMNSVYKNFGYSIVYSDDNTYNINVDSKSDMVCLAYKTTTNIKEAITGLLISERHDASIEYNGCTYYQCGRFNDSDGVLNPNVGCRNRYLYCTKDKWAENGAITKLNFHVLSGARSGSNYVKGYDRNRNIIEAQDLYQGQGSSTYIYISFEKNYVEDNIYPFRIIDARTLWFNKGLMLSESVTSLNIMKSFNQTFSNWYKYSDPTLLQYGWNKDGGSNDNDDLIWSLFEAKAKVPAYCSLSFTADVDIWGASNNHHFNAAIYHNPKVKSAAIAKECTFPAYPYYYNIKKSKQYGDFQTTVLEYYQTDGVWKNAKNSNTFVFENYDKPKENEVSYYLFFNETMSWGGNGYTCAGFKLLNNTCKNPVFTYFFKPTYHSNYGNGTSVAESDFVHSATMKNDGTFQRDGYGLKEWNTKADGTGTSFAPGQNVTASENLRGPVTLYAIWRKKIATNVSSRKTYYSINDAVNDAKNNDSIVVLDNDDENVLVNKPLKINLNSKTVYCVSYTHDAGTAYLYNGTVKNPLNQNSGSNAHNGTTILNNVTVHCVYVKGHDIYLRSGKFGTVYNEKSDGKYGTVHISGRETFVSSIFRDQKDVNNFDITGGFFGTDPTLIVKNFIGGGYYNGIKLPDGYTVVKLAKAPADAPLASYRYEVVKAGGNATNVTKDENKQYANIVLALEDADEDDIIRMNANAENIDVVKAVELDLAGKKIDKLFVDHTSGTLIIRNGVVGTIATKNKTGVARGNVILQDLDVTESVEAVDYNYTIKSGVIAKLTTPKNCNAHVNVTGSDAYVKAFDVQPNTVTLMGGHYLQDPTTFSNMSNAVAIGFYKNRTYPDNDWYKVTDEETEQSESYYWWVSAKPFAQEGTSEDPFLVGTADELLRFSAFVNGGNNEACIRLTSDIDLADKNWMPIGVAYSDGSSVNYKGIIDGDGYVISNMTIADDIAYVEAGLVGRSSYTKIKNLIINNVKLTNNSITRSAPFIGILIGDNTEFHNCASIGTLDVKNSVSGFVNPDSKATKIYNCYTVAATWGTGLSSSTIRSNAYYSDNAKNWAASGELCYKLNGNNGTLMPWRQTIGVDPYPVLRGNNLVAYSSLKIDGAIYFNIKAELDDANHIISNIDKPIELQVAPTEKTTIKAHVRLNKIDSGMNFILGSMKDETGSTSVADAYNAFGIGVDGSDNSFVCATGSRFVHSDPGMAKVGQDYYVTLENGHVRVDTVENASADYYHHDLVMYQFNKNDTKIKLAELAGCTYEPTFADINIYKVEVYEEGILQNQYVPGRMVSNTNEGLSNWLYDTKVKCHLSMSNKTLDAKIALCHDGHMAYTLEGSGKKLVRRCVICGVSYPVTEPYAVWGDMSKVNKCVAWTDSVLNLGKYVFRFESDGKHYVPVSSCGKYYLYGEESDAYEDVNNLVTDTNIDRKSSHVYKEVVNGDNVSLVCKICGHTESNYIKFNNVLSVTIGEEGATTIAAMSGNGSLYNGKKTYTDYNGYSKFSVMKNNKVIHSYKASIYNGVPCFFDPITYDVAVCDVNSGKTMDASLAHVTKCVTHRWFEKGSITDGGKKYRRCMICNEPVEDTRSFIRTNKTSYFNTKMNTTNSTEMKVNFELMKTPSSGDVFFGADNFYVGCSTANTYKVCDQKIDTYTLPVSQNQYLSLTSGMLYLSLDNNFKIIFDNASVSTKAGSTIKIGALADNMSDASDISVYGFDINEGGNLKAHFVPSKRGEQLGFFETVQQKFYPMSGRGATGEIYPCENHEYWDYVTDTVTYRGDKVVSWHKHCRVCDETYDIEDGYRFITNNGHCSFKIDYTPIKFTHINVKYRGSDDFTPVATSNAIFTNGKNEDYNEITIFEGTKLVRDYFPSIWGGKPCLYESVNDTHIFSTPNQLDNGDYVASAYVPKCGYHNFYDLEKKTVDGVVYYTKHCKLCDTRIYLNGMSVENKDVLNKYLFEEDGVHSMYMPIQTKGEEYKYIGTEYPTITGNDLIFEDAVMLEGKLMNYFKPSVFDQKNGVYDVVKDEFIEIPGSEVYINQCEHPYHAIDYKNGEILRRCYICNASESVGNYLYIIYNSNGGNGDRYAQMVTTDKDVAMDCTFTNGASFFGGWKMTDKKGNVIDKIYKAGDLIDAPTAELCDTVVFNAQWEAGFIINGEAPKKVNYANTQEITIIDDGKNGYEATDDFTAQKVNFKRCLDEDYKKEWGTLCIPFSAKSIEGKIQFYAVKSVVDDNSSITPSYKITLEKIDASVAGVPCIYQILDRSIIVDDTLTITSQSYDGVLMKATTEEGSNADVRLKGTYKYYSFVCDENSNYYVISRNSFWRSPSALTMRPYHAYIYHEKTAFTPARNLMYLVTEGEATDIKDITSTDDEIESICTVDGMVVKNMTPGNVYVVKYKSGKVMKVKRTQR